MELYHSHVGIQARDGLASTKGDAYCLRLVNSATDTSKVTLSRNILAIIAMNMLLMEHSCHKWLDDSFATGLQEMIPGLVAPFLPS